MTWKKYIELFVISNRSRRVHYENWRWSDLYHYDSQTSIFVYKNDYTAFINNNNILDFKFARWLLDDIFTVFQVFNLTLMFVLTRRGDVLRTLQFTCSEQRWNWEASKSSLAYKYAPRQRDSPCELSLISQWRVWSFSSVTYNIKTLWAQDMRLAGNKSQCRRCFYQPRKTIPN